MNEKTKLTIRLFYHKGKILRDENGNIATPHGTVALTYGSLEWRNYLKNAISLGITGLNVIKGYESSIHGGNGKEIDLKDINPAIIAEVAAVFEVKRTTLTKEQQEIEDLKQQIKALAESVKTAKPEAEEVEEEPIEFASLSDDELRDKFQEATGNKAHHKTKRGKLISEILKTK